MSVYAASRYPQTLPESLKLKPHGLSTNQLKVYEDFITLPKMILAMEMDRGSHLMQSRPDYGSEESVSLTTAQAVDKFTVLFF